MNSSEFAVALGNFRHGVGEVLRDCVRGRLTDREALADELAIVLFSRDVLARALASADAEAQALLEEIEQVDRLLLGLREELLPLVPHYPTLRERKPRPRSQRWYYLDEILTTPPGFSPEQLAGDYWPPLTSAHRRSS